MNKNEKFVITMDRLSEDSAVELILDYINRQSL